jgi:hypothetical protein
VCAECSLNSQVCFAPSAKPVVEPVNKTPLLCAKQMRYGEYLHCKAGLEDTEDLIRA